ncbi:MAG: tRNA (adenosine(37)-N6)-threonylcarbamoyltransferase complex dimerization subunit type 1 TsaB [Desulfobacteraceae bacterium]|nr:tRNA (adenosine(37)-N6)-threonylcarbamoyltransferase complex dimerization subunit type 1 TsaB [Desulfobacteraceae bacterium]
MKILAISSAEKECSIALIEDKSPVCEELWATKQTHSKRIMDMVARIMDKVGVSVNELDGFIAAKGPGSFTGLRIGISTVKGLAYASGKPCAGISSLDGIAWQFSFSSLPVCVMMDAQRGEVYQATYNFRDGKLLKKSPERVLKPIEVLESLNENTLFAGSGAVAYQEIIKREFEKSAFNQAAKFAPLFLNKIRASALAEVLFQNPSILNDKNDSLVPEYLRKSDAEINKSSID